MHDPEETSQPPIEAGRIGEGWGSRDGAVRDHGRRWRVPLGLADQGVSSLSSLVAVLVVASNSDAATFGAFSLVYTGLTLALGVARGYFGIPIAVSAGSPEDVGPLKTFSGALGAIILLAPAIIVILGLLALLSHTPRSGFPLLVAVAFVTPLILMQDAARFYLFATNRVGRALASDVAWLGCVLALWPLGGTLPTMTFALFWYLAPLVSLLVAVAGMRLRIDWAKSRRMLVPAREVKDASAVSVLLSAGTTMLVGMILLPSFGPQAVGTLRGAGTLFGPINSLVAFLDVGMLAMVTRGQRRHDLRASLLVGSTLVCIVLAWGTVAFRVPDEVGCFVLGETWIQARQILPVTMIEYLFIGLTASAVLFLKVRGNAASIFLVKVVSTSIILLGCLMVSLLRLGFHWIPWVLVCGAAVGACMQWVVVLVSNRKKVM